MMFVVTPADFSARLFARDFVRNARRFHEREQFVDSFLCCAPNIVHIKRPGDSYLADDGANLVTKVAQEAQWIARLICDPGNDPHEQNLRGDHAPVQLFHRLEPLD
jgi:hypothetical protein